MGGKAVSARFTICGQAKRIDCIVDGHTVWMAGTKIRIADIDTPETHPPRCAREARLGQAATLKMQALLNAGPFTLTPIKRDVDRYGRKLRIVERDGKSLGAMLVRHGLARRYGGGKRSPWCGWGRRGRLIGHDAVKRWLSSWGSAKPLPQPRVGG